MKIALCQFDTVWEDCRANRDKIRALVEKSPAGWDWIVFPEMTLSGFSMDTSKTTTRPEDIEFFSRMAKERKAWVSFGGVEDGFNKLITFDRSGARASEYSKINLYSFAGEDKRYKRGTEQTTFPIEGMAVTPAVCFDLRFPHIFWDRAERTELFVDIAAWPARRSEHWTTLLKARAIENQCYVVGVNRTGKDPTLEYSGNSAIFDPLGKTVLDCGTAEGVFVSEAAVEKALVEKTRARFPFFKDRRPVLL
ncbi:MAG: nitrilase-related carbon-nitrogen hydrolase [Elusimicrobiota bacterium]